MKKLLSLILAAVCLLSSAAFAETPDLEAMDFESLAALKTAVDAELNARPEAQKFELYPGNYTVGVDIKAGRYFIIMNHPKKDYTPRFSVYKTQKQYDERESGKMGETIYDKYIDFGDPLVTVELADGNYIYLLSDSLTLKAAEFTEDDYYK